VPQKHLTSDIHDKNTACRVSKKKKEEIRRKREREGGDPRTGGGGTGGEGRAVAKRGKGKTKKEKKERTYEYQGLPVDLRGEENEYGRAQEGMGTKPESRVPREEKRGSKPFVQLG